MSAPHTYNNEEIKELLTRIAAGDEHAFTVVFEAYYPGIYKAALYVTASKVLAEEVVQDVFLKLWVRRDLLHEINDLGAYLFIAARNQAYKALQKQARWEMAASLAGSDGEATFDQIEDLEAEMEAERIRSVYEAAVDALPTQQKRAFQLSKQAAMSRKQVAEAMQLSPESVKKYLSLAVLNIRAYCQAQAPELLTGVVFLVVIHLH